MKTDYPRLYAHVKAIYALDDGEKRLRHAMKNINEENFDGGAWSPRSSLSGGY